MSTVAEQTLARKQVHGFIDVLRSRSEWPAVDKSEPGAYLTGRRRLPLPDGPVTVELVTLAHGSSGGAALPGDEFVLVLSGIARFRQKGRQLDVAARQAAVVLGGEPVEWLADEPTELIVMRCMAGGSADAPVVIDTSAPLAPSNPPLAELLVGPTPSCRNHSDFCSATGEFVCGTWDSTPYHRRLMQLHHFELMRLLEGEVSFADQLGQTGTFREGDVVLFVQGGSSEWESRSRVKKIYATYRPVQ